MQKVEFESLQFEIFQEVYLPAEDSYLLAKYAKKQKGRILEIGCGCGFSSIICAKNNPENIVFGVDINQYAIENSSHNAKINSVCNAHFIYSDLFQNVFGKFDCIFFNPPYLPTEKEEKINSPENYAYDGGHDGRKTIDIFLNKFEKYLNPEGKILFIQSSLNDFEKTKSILTNMHFSFKILEEEKFFFEKLFLLEAKRS